MLFSMTKDKKWKISLYSTKEIDMSPIAKEYGGGGHAKACGMTLDSLPF